VLGADLLLWMPWALALTAVAVGLGVRAYRRGDRLGATSWVGWALIPPALLLTGTLRLVGRVSGAVLDWSASLVFTPTTWVGLALAGTAAVLVGGSRALRRRQQPDPAPAARAGRVDDELADVEEILRRRGIS